MNGITAALTGRIGQDADLKYLPTGNALATSSVAADDVKKTDGEQAEWVRVTVWGKAAEELTPRLVKGTRVYCEGRLKLEQWQAKDGTQRSTLKLSGWVCQPMGQIGKNRPCPEAPYRQAGAGPRRMPTMAAAVGYRDHPSDDRGLAF